METKRLYQIVADLLRKRICNNIYAIDEKLPSERLICEETGYSRTVIREAMIMLEVEGFVEVQKGSGVKVIANSQKPTDIVLINEAGPFELLQARQLIECSIVEFAAMQVTKADINDLIKIQEIALAEDRYRDSEWDKAFHIKISECTQNSSLSPIIEMQWKMREQNRYWKKLHEHIDSNRISSWHDDHNEILKALVRKDPSAAKMAMWQHLENTKQMLFKASSIDFDIENDHYLFADNPVVSIDDYGSIK